jgi:hypothetical protein
MTIVSTRSVRSGLVGLSTVLFACQGSNGDSNGEHPADAHPGDAAADGGRGGSPQGGSGGTAGGSGGALQGGSGGSEPDGAVGGSGGGDTSCWNDGGGEQACAACCSDRHPNAYLLQAEATRSCACASTAVCASPCASDYCVSQAPVSPVCSSCVLATVVMDGPCYTPAREACGTDAACLAYVECRAHCSGSR